MQYNFSDQKKFSTWRKLWVNLAKAEKVCKQIKHAVTELLINRLAVLLRLYNYKTF